MVDGLGGWWLVAWCKPTCGHHATTTHWRCACCLTLSSCPFSLPFCPFLFLFLFLLLLLWMKSAKLGAMPSTHHQVLCALCLVWWWVCGCGVWWCWLARHACMGGTSGCGWCVWPLVPPTTLVVPVVPVSVVLVSMSPPLFPLTLTHTQAWHTTTPHTHTHGWWLVHFGPWCVCVCVGTVLAVAAPGSPLTPPPTPSAPLHSTSPLAAAAAAGGGGGCGGGSVGVVACVATWSTHWLCWCCPLPHPHTHTHTHGVVGTWWWWLCVWCGCHHHCAPFPPTTTTVSAAPPCPLCVRVSVCGGTTHSGALWWHARWCVAERAPCPPHPPPTLSTLVRSLSSRSPSLTSHTHTHKWHASRHTHTWRGLCGSTHAPQPVSTRLGALPWPSQPLVSFLCVLWCAPQLTPFSTHTHRGGNGLWCRVAQKSALREREDEHTHSPTSFSFLFSHNPFQWRIWRHPLSLTSTFHSLVHSLSRLCACK